MSIKQSFIQDNQTIIYNRGHNLDHGRTELMSEIIIFSCHYIDNSLSTSHADILLFLIPILS